SLHGRLRARLGPFVCIRNTRLDRLQHAGGHGLPGQGGVADRRRRRALAATRSHAPDRSAGAEAAARRPARLRLPDRCDLPRGRARLAPAGPRLHARHDRRRSHLAALASDAARHDRGSVRRPALRRSRLRPSAWLHRATRAHRSRRGVRDDARTVGLADTMLTARASLLAALTLAVAQLPSAGSVIGTIRVSVHEDALFTARGDTLFLVRFPEEHAKSITVERIGPSGTRSKRLPFPLAYYLTDLSSGAHGLYLGTSVIKRFTSAPDELVR